MTDSSSLNTHTAPPIRTTATSGPNSVDTAPLQNAAPVPGNELEDYTIKCICGFQDDDGNTVYCDPCDTWQHTECYYIDKHGVVPTNEDLKHMDHFCADCQPRPLDTKGAIERQKNRREELDPSERKVKKAAAKSHKKKIRVPESNAPLTNGWAHASDPDLVHDRTSRSPRDPLPPAKRPKTNHRLSNSMHFPVLEQTPTSQPHKRSGSNIHSPSKMHPKDSPNRYVSEPYSVEFLHLYDDDPGDTPMQTNLHNDIQITRDLSLWSHDVEALRVSTKGLPPQEVFNRCDQPIDSMPLPELIKETKQDEGVIIDGRCPRWTYLTIDTFRPQGSIISELKGTIGFMQDYTEDPANKWDYLRHPAPFVFFHPRLPIYIDTRSEGTICRYLRRSCTPNLSMKTFLENGSEYHFCFVAKENLEVGSELTIGWVLDEHIRNFFFHRSSEEIKQEGDNIMNEDYVTDWVGKVLAEFGGCACNSPNTCSLARYDRRSTSIPKGRNGFTSKHSPTNTCYATNSRDGSEQNDGRSSSGSQSQSRDVTPIRNAPGDLGFGAGLEISDREKRKIAALEKNFEQLENDKNQPAHKKKKRNSGGSIVNTPSAGISKQLGHTAMPFSQPNTPGLLSKTQYVDASTSRPKSGSPTAKLSNPVGRPRSVTTLNSKKRSSQPNTPVVPSPLIRQNYVSSSMQTEPDEEDDWYNPPVVPAPMRRSYTSLTKRLLLRSQKDREKLEERKKSSLGTLDESLMNSQSASVPNNFAGVHMHEDKKMQDAESTEAPSSAPVSTDPAAQNPWSIDRRSSIPDRTIPGEIKPPPPWAPHTTQPTAERSRPINGFRPNDLRVQLPPRPFMPSESTSNTPLLETPTSAVPQSPFTQNPTGYASHFPNSSSNLIQPSPIKKKVSLGEYFNRRKGSQSTAEKTTSSSPTMQQSTLKPSISLNEESKGMAIEGSAIADTPKKEEGDPLGTIESKDPKL